MKAIGRGSLSEALRAVLWVVRILCVVMLALTALLAVTALLAYTAGDVALPGVVIEALSPAYYVFPSIVLLAGLFIVAYIVTDRLTRVFATLTAGDPFVHENADHLRVIWVVLVIFEIARYAMAGVMALIRQIVLEVGDASTAGAVKAGVWLIEPVIWFAILVIAVLSEVFREGARLRDEQKLTI